MHDTINLGETKTVSDVQEQSDEECVSVLPDEKIDNSFTFARTAQRYLQGVAHISVVEEQ